jgi:hypothetical protein
MVKLTSRAIWSELAAVLAREAHLEHFPSRRGLWVLEDEGALCVCNNNPYAKHPPLRDEETMEFRRRMEAAGIKVLAYETYPPRGEEDAGYTYALLLEAGADKSVFVADTMLSVMSFIWDKFSKT